MTEVIIGLLGVLTAAISWYIESRKNDPLKKEIEQLQVDKAELLDKYARSVGRVKTLEKLTAKYKKELYERMDADDLVSAWNDGLLWDDEDPGETN